MHSINAAERASRSNTESNGALNATAKEALVTLTKAFGVKWQVWRAGAGVGKGFHYQREKRWELFCSDDRGMFKCNGTRGQT